MSERKDGQVTVVHGSGDVFRDLGVEIAPEEEIKIAIAKEIVRIINVRRYTQSQVAILLGTDQSKVSNIVRGKFTGLSVDRLLKYLLRLGIDIDVHLSEPRLKKADEHHSGKVKVHTALAAVG